MPLLPRETHSESACDESLSNAPGAAPRCGDHEYAASTDAEKERRGLRVNDEKSEVMASVLGGPFCVRVRRVYKRCLLAVWAATLGRSSRGPDGSPQRRRHPSLKLVCLPSDTTNCVLPHCLGCGLTVGGPISALTL